MFDVYQSFGQDFSGFMKLAISVVTLLVAGMVFLKLAGIRLPQGAFSRFHPDVSLKDLVRTSISTLFSRWWLFLVPFAILMIRPFQMNLSIWMYMQVDSDLKKMIESSNNTSSFQENYYTVSLGAQRTLGHIPAIINEELDSPLQVWELNIFSYLCILLSIISLIWLYRVYKKSGDLASAQNLRIMAWFGVFLITGITASIFWMFPSGEFSTYSNLRYSLYRTFGYLLPIASLAALFSLWFAAVYKAVDRKAGVLAGEGDVEKLEGWFPPDLVFSAFPVFVFLFIVQFILLFLKLSFFPLFTVFNILPYFLQEMIEGTEIALWSNSLHSLKIIISWALFPLPFIAARNRLGLRESLAALKQTWKTHFPKLCWLAILIVAEYFCLEFVCKYNFIRSFTAPEADFKFSLWYFPGLIYMLLSGIVVIIQMTAFLSVMFAFRLGLLDIESAPE